jgi:hypothetical protein
MGATICNLDQFKIREITTAHSNASAREIINENFRNVKEKILCIGSTIANSVMITPPNPPIVGMNYVVQYTGSGYVLVQQSSGTKYKIRNKEKIFVGSDYQYILYNAIDIDAGGAIEVETGGQLIIFN